MHQDHAESNLNMGFQIACGLSASLSVANQVTLLVVKLLAVTN
jgi:hypothetical protein